ncbi:MAG: YceI family protein [Acidimicrobiales bacterium]
MARYRIVPERSRVWIDARSTLHPIHSSTDGLEGFVDLEFGSDGSLDSGADASGKLSLAVDRLSSGKRMEDRELQRSLDARRFPTIEGELRGVDHQGEDRYRVLGDITVRGTSCSHEDEMTIRSLGASTIELAGSSRFDIRDFGLEPPRVLMIKVFPEVNVRVQIAAERTE